MLLLFGGRGRAEREREIIYRDKNKIINGEIHHWFEGSYTDEMMRSSMTFHVRNKLFCDIFIYPFQTRSKYSHSDAQFAIAFLNEVSARLKKKLSCSKQYFVV